jgi:hypothetical protein
MQRLAEYTVTLTVPNQTPEADLNKLVHVLDLVDLRERLEMCARQTVLQNTLLSLFVRVRAEE